jgi:lipopolysaccharide/colanic/teichoic acid biosynthesis glycosyltransferase
MLDGSILGLEVVGALNGEEVSDRVVNGVPFLGSYSDLEVIIHTHEINQVVLLETRNNPEWVRSVRDICEKEGCQLLVYNPWSDYFDQALIPMSSGIHTFFAFQEEPLESPLNRFLKRLLDYLIAIPVVLLILGPCALIVRYFQKKQSPGPLFHVQLRSGINREAFKIYKFRSMHEGEGASTFPFGAFMRRHSLDEFPQFLNVLKGDMSVVGPRPHMLKHDDLFGAFIKIYKYRHFVRPGVTGLAQVSGRRGEISDVDRIRERIILDLKYMYEWSLSLDLIIILKTIFQIFKPPPSAG